MDENVQKMIASMRSSVKGLNISIMSNSDVAKREGYIKTPALDLNRILSGDLYKGIPNKTLVGITGPEHSFKSSFAVLCAADASKNGYLPVIIDTEAGITTEFCQRWGLDIENAIYISEIWLEKIIAFIANLKEVAKGQKMIIIIDSIGGLDRYKTYKDALEDDTKQDQGQLQRSIRTLLKLFLHVCVETDSIGIFTAHLMSKPGLIPLPDDVAGGKAVKLFPSIFINLKKEAMKKDEKQEGSLLVATTMKNRFYPPFQTAVIDIDYNKGINRIAGLLELMLPDRANILRKEGNTYYLVSNNEKFATYDSGAQKALANPDNKELLDKLNDWLKTTGYSTVNQNVKEAEEMFESMSTDTESVPKNKRSKTIKNAVIKNRVKNEI